MTNQIIRGVCILGFLFALPAFSYDQIIRQFQDVRTSGMGGVFETTGLYEQNFFGNPARVCANPSWRLTLVDVTAETDTSAISHIGVISNVIKGSGNVVQQASETAGSDNHARVQMAMPAWYLPPSDHRKWGMAVGLFIVPVFPTTTAFDLGLGNNYSINTQVFIDIGPAVTYGHTFLNDDSLAIGVTGHLAYRLSTHSPYSVADLLNGTSFSPKDVGGEGTDIDFDVGATKKLNWHPDNLDFEVALAVDDVLGGNYNGTLFHPINAPNRPQPAYRGFGGGISVHKDQIFFLHDPVFALEASDIGTRNQYGSIYRTLHMGGETRLISVLLARIGLNQGYFTAGVGIDLRVLTIDVATYGEELGLNAGDMQDRRYALRVALQL